jgi:hypothetical protein
MNTPAQDISDGLRDLGFDIISVKQMSTTCRSLSEGALNKNFHIFLITLPIMAISEEIFQLPALCHIAIRHTGLRMAVHSATTANSSVTFGQTVSNFTVVCGARRRPARVSREEECCLYSSMLQLPVGGVRETPSRQLSGLQTRRRNCRRINRKEHSRLQRERYSPQTLLHQVSPSRRRS